VKRRQRPQDVKLKPYHRNGYGHAFEAGSMRGAWYGVFEEVSGDQFTLAELAKAWEAYRDDFLESAEGKRKSWAELVFDENIDPHQARDLVGGRQNAEAVHPD
jgi:hypothetical protein